MRTIKVNNKKILFRFIMATFSGLLLCVLTVGISAFALTKTDVDFEKYFIFLLVAAALGSLISCFISCSALKTKRFFISIGQGALTSLLFFLIILAVNGFAVTGTAWLVPAVGAVSGVAAGLILSYIR